MPRCRPFKLIDIMILIAAAAMGMTSIRTLWNRLHMFGMASKTGLPWSFYASSVHASLTIAIFSLAVAYVWIRLIPPRLRMSDLIRQPGMLSLVLLIGLLFPLMALSAFVPLADSTEVRIFALALGLSWGAACHRYRSRAEAGWIEGLGRSVGVGLVVAIATSYSW